MTTGKRTVVTVAPVHRAVQYFFFTFLFALFSFLLYYVVPTTSAVPTYLFRYATGVNCVEFGQYLTFPLISALIGAEYNYRPSQRIMV